MMKVVGKRVQGAVRLCGVLLVLGMLASCGGGTEQVDPFAPTRLIVLGDEMSVLTKEAPQGRKYSVNALTTDGSAIDCVARPLWHQAVAYTFGFTYEECNPDGVTDHAAKVYAEPGAKLDDLPAQLARARLEHDAEWSNTDLFTVLVGANDVIDLYERVYLADPTQDTINAINNELQLRGQRLGTFVNELTRLEVTGPKVLVSTIPLMNLTPYAIKQTALHPGLNVPSVLQQFSRTYNTAMRVTIQNDGRFIGLVELDALINAGVTNPGGYGLANITEGVCAVALPDCSTNTLVTNGNATTWLWADDLWMGSTGHLYLGNFARGRALGNPF